MNRKPLSLAAVTLAALLAACGGGGGDDETAPAGTAATNPATSSKTTDPIDAYYGTIVTNCISEKSARNAATDAVLYVIKAVTATTKLSPTSAAYDMQYRFYSDAACTVPVATFNKTGGATTLTIDGRTTIDGRQVDKITTVESPALSGISGATITINGVTFSQSSRYTASSTTTDKDLGAWEGSNLYGGDWTKPLDADGYPTALSSESSARKI